MEHTYKLEYNTLLESGVCVVKGVFTDEEIERTRNSLGRLVVAQLDQLNLKVHADLFENFRELHKAEIKRYLGTLKTFFRTSAVYDLVVSQKIMRIVHEFGIGLPLISAEPVVHVISEKLMIPNGYFGQGTHQDWTSMQGSLKAIVCWIPLMDVGPNNFPVEFATESHLDGLLPGTPQANYFEIDPHIEAQLRFETFDLKQGDVVFFTQFTPHRTKINCEGFRIAASLRFEDSLEPHFVQRNFPSAYKRTVERQLLDADFPSRSQVRNIFKKPN